MKILGDNKINSILMGDLESQNQTKHIDVMYHHIHRLVEEGKLTIN